MSVHTEIIYKKIILTQILIIIIYITSKISFPTLLIKTTKHFILSDFKTKPSLQKQLGCFVTSTTFQHSSSPTIKLHKTMK